MVPFDYNSSNRKDCCRCDNGHLIGRVMILDAVLSDPLIGFYKQLVGIRQVDFDRI